MEGKELSSIIKREHPSTILFEKRGAMDVRETRWAHPVILDGPFPWSLNDSTGDDGMGDVDNSNLLSDPATTLEERRAIGGPAAKALHDSLAGMMPPDDRVTIEQHWVPGCPEEPETKADVRVYRPKGLTGTGNRALFYILGGGMVMNEPLLFPIADYTCSLNCVTVVVKYRLAWEAPYPASINDCHAGYAWMIDHCDELGIDPDNVVIFGGSTGGHLSLAMGFRLKRYGFSPKGIMAMVPQTDERIDYDCIFKGHEFDSLAQHNMLMAWVGEDVDSRHLGPEAFPNHATVEDCIGYPPTVIHGAEFDPDRVWSREFVNKLQAAHTYVEYHLWHGTHSSSQWSGTGVAGPLNEYSERVKVVMDGNLNDFFNYDLRRPWVVDER